jgi:hypothetical protein
LFYSNTQTETNTLRKTQVGLGKSHFNTFLIVSRREIKSEAENLQAEMGRLPSFGGFFLETNPNPQRIPTVAIVAQ